MNDKAIVIIDDEFNKTKGLGTLLISDGYNVKIASNKDEAIDITVKIMPFLIIIKAILIDASEFDIIRGLRSIDALKTIPIVMVTETEEDFNDISVISKYKPDYGIIKVIQIPIDEEEFLSFIRECGSHIEKTFMKQTEEIEDKDVLPFTNQGDTAIGRDNYIVEDNAIDIITDDLHSNKDTQKDFYDTLQDNIKGEGMANNKNEDVEIDGEPHIHYEDSDFNEPAENEKKHGAGYSEKISGLLEMIKSKKIIPVLMIGVAVVIFAVLIITKISQKQIGEKKDELSSSPAREILTIIEPPDKKTSSNITEQSNNEPAAKEGVKNEPTVKEPPKNEPVAKEGVKNEPTVKEPPKNEPVAKEGVKNEPTVKEPPKNEPALKQQHGRENLTIKPEKTSKVSQPAKTTTALKKNPIITKEKPKTAETKKVESKVAQKIIKKPTMPSHSPKSVTAAKNEAKNEPKKEAKTVSPTTKSKTSQPMPKSIHAPTLKAEPKQETKSSSVYSVQVGLFNNSANAISILNKLQSEKYEGKIKEIHKKDKTIYLVTIGRFNTKKEAMSVVLRLKTINKIDAFVIKL